MSSIKFMPASAPTRTLPPPGVSPLLHILRNANARCSAIAAAVRAAQRPTHHARKRATALCLTLDVERARGCAHTHVSTIPLPVLERDEPLDMGASAGAKPRTPAMRPLVLAAPVPMRTAHRAHPYAHAYARAEAEGGEEGGEKRMRSVQIVVPPRVGRPGLRLRSSPLSAGSSSSEESVGPVTPQSSESPPLKICIKRKQSADAGAIVDKRPKYERKRWATRPLLVAE